MTGVGQLRRRHVGREDRELTATAERHHPHADEDGETGYDEDDQHIRIVPQVARVRALKA
ncbi:hypothetical protein Psi02_17820 [Planotetraspora silvatica]|uniref:Uncharacterized protein n=1 Tax=Planotetraspora silvatica TaxID=234614 RepID=A0A8J3UGT3_9ACTN|nr:hypothetical protein Psi02_17820 [Planotetraspora silvatica]